MARKHPRPSGGVIARRATPSKNSIYQVAACAYCSRDIMRMSFSEPWLHDDTGWQRCDGLPEPIPKKERNVHLHIV